MSSSSGSADSIRIPRIRARCVLGVRPWERRRRRRVEISLTIEADLGEAAAGDSLERTVDYSAAARRVREAVAGTRFQLLEALAGHVAAVVLDLPRVRAVEVTVSKPGAVRRAGAPEVRMRREKT
jgi:dihydroneopterin aldolase